MMGRLDLDRDEVTVRDWMRQRVDESLADPRPNIPARTVFKRLREMHAHYRAWAATDE
jgi:hypothetical protein